MHRNTINNLKPLFIYSNGELSDGSNLELLTYDTDACLYSENTSWCVFAHHIV